MPASRSTATAYSKCMFGSRRLSCCLYSRLTRRQQQHSGGLSFVFTRLKPVLGPLERGTHMKAAGTQSPAPGKRDRGHEAAVAPDAVSATSTAASGQFKRNYAGALQALDSLQSNESVLKAWKRQRMQDKSVTLVDEMRQLLADVGVDPDAQSLVHVAGTKGKGSVCAMVESILREAGARTGLFTSPHLVHPRERIRINGQPVSEDLFAESFWTVWDRLQESVVRTRGERMPAYFRFLTVLGTAVFHWERVDVVVLEVGVGGRADATNFCRSSTLSVVTALGLDHCSVLGDTLPLIAAEKAGIFKAGRPALVHAQGDADAAAVLLAKARERGASSFHVVRDVSASDHPVIPLALAGPHQQANAALAAVASAVWLRERARARNTTTPHDGGREQRPIAEPEPAERQGSPSVGTLDRCSLEPDEWARVLRLAPPESPPAAVAPGAEFHVSLNQGSELPECVVNGLARCHWLGRSHVLRFLFPSARNLTLYLDVAHTTESMTACTDWFWAAASSSATATDRYCVLFNCATNRDPTPMLRVLAAGSAPPANRRFDRVMFSTHRAFSQVSHNKQRGEAPPMPGPAAVSSSSSSLSPNLSWQRGHRDKWEVLASAGPASGVESAAIEVCASVEDALALLEREAAAQPDSQVHLLVTGSVYLVGAVFEVLTAKGISFEV